MLTCILFLVFSWHLNRYCFKFGGMLSLNTMKHGKCLAQNNRIKKKQNIGIKFLLFTVFVIVQESQKRDFYLSVKVCVNSSYL